MKEGHTLSGHFISWVKSDEAGYAIKEEITLV